MTRADCEGLILIIAIVGVVLMLTEPAWKPALGEWAKPECVKVRV